jgi:tellurite resistance protein TerC
MWMGTPLSWSAFLAVVAALLAVDLGLFHRRPHEVRFREALLWSGVWIGVALAFNALIWWRSGGDAATEFLTAYLVEKSLSVDNVFIFVAIFGALAIPAEHQHRVLFWGVVSALLMRITMIVGGAAALQRFHWLVYVFGAVLVLSGLKLLVLRGGHGPPGAALRLVGWIVPSTERLDGGRFWTREAGRKVATPLFTSLVTIELADVVMAVDSVPAVLAVTDDPFIAFTSNALALLGLRALFFVLAGAVHKFRYLKVGLAGVLVFVGAKMTLASIVKVSPAISLAVVVALLGASILVSMARDDLKTRDLFVHAGGWALLGVGAALLVLPGPGIPLVIAGLAILGRRHAWARSAAHRIRTRTQKWIDRVRPPRSGRKPQTAEPGPP